MAKYWLYMRPDSRISAESLDIKTMTFRQRSCYSGEQLKYLMVPGTIKGEVWELPDDRLAAIKEEVASLNIHPHPVRDGAFMVSEKPGDPLGKLLTILPLDKAHERGYLHLASPDPYENLFN